jgi:hypothetical protein
LRSSIIRSHSDISRISIDWFRNSGVIILEARSKDREKDVITEVFADTRYIGNDRNVEVTENGSITFF